MNENFAKEIKEKRLEAGLTQEELARLCGVTLSTVSRWERGTFKPSKLAIEKIRAKLDTDLAVRKKNYE